MCIRDRVKIHPALLEYMARLAQASRSFHGVELGVSPRGTLSLMRASRALSLIHIWVYKGSPRYLPSETEPVASPAVEHLGKLAAGYTPEKPLYVVALGAITHVASALLLEPSIRDTVVLV